MFTELSWSLLCFFVGATSSGVGRCVHGTELILVVDRFLWVVVCTAYCTVDVSSCGSWFHVSCDSWSRVNCGSWFHTSCDSWFHTSLWFLVSRVLLLLVPRESWWLIPRRCSTVLWFPKQTVGFKSGDKLNQIGSVNEPSPTNHRRSRDTRYQYSYCTSDINIRHCTNI